MCVFGINASHPWDYRIYDFRLSSFKRDSFARGHSKSATVLKTMAFTSDLGEILKETGKQTTWPASWETYMQVRKQQLELDMEQQTGSK